MSYDVFKERVRGLVNRSGSKVSFHHEDGKHIARCSDGITPAFDFPHSAFTRACDRLPKTR